MIVVASYKVLALFANAPFRCVVGYYESFEDAARVAGSYWRDAVRAPLKIRIQETLVPASMVRRRRRRGP